jgi:hypothetical protein
LLESYGTNTQCEEIAASLILKEVIYTHIGKEIPVQAWTGPEGSRRLRLPDFQTIGT